jgi:hypothetical protein
VAISGGHGIGIGLSSVINDAVKLWMPRPGGRPGRGMFGISRF